MKKLKLDLGSLAVETFEPVRLANNKPGTVRAHGGSGNIRQGGVCDSADPYQCASVTDCPSAIQSDCPIDTCGQASCQFTCAVTCGDKCVNTYYLACPSGYTCDCP